MQVVCECMVCVGVCNVCVMCICMRVTVCVMCIYMHVGCVWYMWCECDVYAYVCGVCACGVNVCAWQAQRQHRVNGTSPGETT